MIQPGTTPLLRAEHIVLRPFSARDGVKIGLEQEIAEALAAEAQQGRSLLWLLAPGPRDPGIGWVGLRAIDAVHRRAMLDGFLPEAERHQGRMAGAARRVINYGFADMGLHRIALRLDPGQAAGIALARKLRFTEEGRLRGYRLGPAGQPRDVLLFSLLRGDSVL